MPEDEYFILTLSSPKYKNENPKFVVSRKDMQHKLIPLLNKLKLDTKRMLKSLTDVKGLILLENKELEEYY
jgi:hypothetical protein